MYPLSEDFVLKVPHDDPGPISSMHIEVIAVGAAYAADVRTPRLVAFDDSLDLLPVPYLVLERIHGEPLAAFGSSADSVRHVWQEVGRDLALTHTRVHADNSMRCLPTHDQSTETDPRPWVEEAQRNVHLKAAQARWLGEVLDRLAPTALAQRPKRFCHGDVNAGNVFVRAAEPRHYVGLLDWGGAGWGDPGSDFSGIPLRAVASVLAGYQDVAPLEDESSMMARILWSYLQLALFSLKRHPDTAPERIERLLLDTRWFEREAHL